MLESKNPKIDAAKLAARVQTEVERARTAVPPSAPNPPKGLIATPFDKLREEVLEMIDQARESNRVRPGIPGFLHLFVRNQGRCNRLLLRVVERQEKQIVQLQMIVSRQAEQIAKLQMMVPPAQ
jgi:hypothetical protein